jgi:superfamily I DNA and/or RNA helicase
MEFFKEKFFNVLIFIFDRLIMADNPFSRKVLSDVDRRLESRKPIEAIKDDIADIKSDLVHIKNYIRKNEIRQQLIEEKYKQEKYEILDDEKESEKNKSWFW